MHLNTTTTRVITIFGYVSKTSSKFVQLHTSYHEDASVQQRQTDFRSDTFPVQAGTTIVSRRCRTLYHTAQVCTTPCGKVATTCLHTMPAVQSDTPTAGTLVQSATAIRGRISLTTHRIEHPQPPCASPFISAHVLLLAPASAPAPALRNGRSRCCEARHVRGRYLRIVFLLCHPPGGPFQEDVCRPEVQVHLLHDGGRARSQRSRRFPFHDGNGSSVFFCMSHCCYADTS